MPKEANLTVRAAAGGNRLLRLAVMLLAARGAYGYSVLAHEAVIDAVWDASIVPLLRSHFPLATSGDLNEAHAYAYGGAVLQDLGYYPFSSRFFSDLTHYVRSGDFVIALVREARNVDEYAFALGAAAHYAADNSGHRLATNPAVSILYPELRARYGKTVTYWENPLSHIRTEFGFDVLQVAQGRYAPDNYRAFIGFQVAKPALERAFRDTYGIEMREVFGDLDLALGSFRYSVGSIIPGMTRVAWELRRETLIREIPGVTRKKFLFNLSRSTYEKQWGRGYRRPGVRSRFVALLLRFVPKSGPFKSLAFRAPTPEVERLFMASFNATIDAYRGLLGNIASDQPVLANENFDVGVVTLADQYLGADISYDKLLEKLAAHRFAGVSTALRDNILVYYSNRKSPVAPLPRKAAAEWAKLLEERAQLLAFQPNTTVAPQSRE